MNSDEYRQSAGLANGPNTSTINVQAPVVNDPNVTITSTGMKSVVVINGATNENKDEDIDDMKTPTVEELAFPCQKAV